MKRLVPAMKLDETNVIRPRKVASSLLASLLILQSGMNPSLSAVTPKVTVNALNLETAIENLEKANDRSETVQAMADLFESAGEKTLLARSKYKYVRYDHS